MQEAAKPSPFDSDAFAQASREARLIVDEAGRVQAIDKVGQRLLCLEVGASLLESAEHLGTAAKLKSLLTIALHKTAPSWDLALLAAGKPVNCEVSAWPAGAGHIALLARLIPDNARRSISQMSDALRDVVSLNDEITQQKDALRDLNQQLTESNQGVVALHHELQDKAREAVATSEIRNRIVANVSHEFRTPMVVTVTNREQKARALGADEFWLKPIDQDRLIRKLQGLARDAVPSRVLLIDDNKQARYLVNRFLANTSFGLLEAETGKRGLEVARREHPDVILLDFVLPDMTGLDVLDELKADPQTRQIPVVIVTSQQLTGEELRRLSEQSETILTKDKLTRELAISRIRDALAKVGVHPTSALNKNEYA